LDSKFGSLPNLVKENEEFESAAEVPRKKMSRAKAAKWLEMDNETMAEMGLS
jgi:hypothetical protein